MATSKNWFPIFKTGKHVSSAKKPYEATAEKLDKIAAVNQGKDVPLAIGHPKGKFTKFGSAPEFKRVGEILYARPKEVDAEFEGWVKDGYLQGISISVNEDFTLNHIGFLGAKKPGVDLPAAEFSAPEGGDTFEFSMREGWAFQSVATMFQRMRDWMIETAGLEKTDAVISQWTIDDIKRYGDELLVKEESTPAAAFSAPDIQGGDMDAKEKEELSQLRQRNKQLEEERAANRKKQQRQEFESFLDGKVKVGDREVDMKEVVTPAMRPSVLGLMEFMSATETYEFSAADGTKAERSPLEVFKTVVLPNLKDQVSAAEFARHDTAGTKTTTEEEQVVKDIASAATKA